MPGSFATVMPWESSMLRKPRSTISSIIVSPSEWRLLFQQEEKASIGKRLAAGGLGRQFRMFVQGFRKHFLQHGFQFWREFGAVHHIDIGGTGGGGDQFPVPRDSFVRFAGVVVSVDHENDPGEVVVL